MSKHENDDWAEAIGKALRCPPDTMLAGTLPRRGLWLEEAEAAIRKADPTAAAVVDAVRSFAVLGRPSVLTARLADNSEWLIDGQTVRRLTAEEVAGRAQMRESFQ